MTTSPERAATEEPTVRPAATDRRPWTERFEDQLLEAAVRQQERQGS